MIRKNVTGGLDIVTEKVETYSYEQIQNIIAEWIKRRDDSIEKIEYYKNVLAQATALGIKPRDVSE